MKAAYNGHAPVVAQLIKSGADVTHTDKVKENLLFHLIPVLSI